MEETEKVDAGVGDTAPIEEASTDATGLGGISRTLNILQPSNILVLVVFYSPIIVCFTLLALSFVFQNFKGFIYLGFLLAASICREFLYSASGAKEPVPSMPVCSTVQYSKVGNNTYSAFMLAFTLVYIGFPMFLNDSMNWLLFGSLMAYLITDVTVRYMYMCTVDISLIALNVIGGMVFAITLVSLVNAGGSSSAFFFNDIQSNKVVCSRPSKQQFKCQVYRNGQLINSENKDYENYAAYRKDLRSKGKTDKVQTQPAISTPTPTKNPAGKSKMTA